MKPWSKTGRQYRQTDKQAYGQTDMQSMKPTGKQTDRQTNRRNNCSACNWQANSYKERRLALIF